MEYAGAVEVTPPFRASAQDWVRGSGWTPSRDGQTIRPRAGITLDDCVGSLRDLVMLDVGVRTYEGVVAAYDATPARAGHDHRSPGSGEPADAPQVARPAALQRDRAGDPPTIGVATRSAVADLARPVSRLAAPAASGGATSAPDRISSSRGFGPSLRPVCGLRRPARHGSARRRPVRRSPARRRRAASSSGRRGAPGRARRGRRGRPSGSSSRRRTTRSRRPRSSGCRAGCGSRRRTASGSCGRTPAARAW